MKIWVVASGIAYQLTYQASTERYNQHLSDVQKTIESIKLFTPTGCEVGATATNECHPSYPDNCIPPPPPDLSCVDEGVPGNLRVVGSDPGSDPHGFDSDNDGIGCEDSESNCHPSYPDNCIPPPPPDLNCDDIDARNFEVSGSDPHGFDPNNDGIECEG